MTVTPSDCRRARRDLPRRESLGAADRSRLELHLRRCEACRRLADGLHAVESGPPEISPLDEERVRAIHDRLIPLAHELSSRAVGPRPWLGGLRPVLAPVAVAALFLAALAVVTLQGRERGAALAGDARPVAAAASASAVLEGTVDRCEGFVSIDGQEPSDPRGRFAVRPGTTIDLAEDGRFGFRIGTEVRVALGGEAALSLIRAGGSFFEFELERGRMAVEFDGGGGRMLDVRTPDSLVRVRGTVFTVEAAPGTGTRVGVIEGRVGVLPADGAGVELEVAAGEVLDLPDGSTDGVGDEERALAADLAPPGGDDVDPEFGDGGRLVRFAGSPERVVVEVEGRVVGITPLTVRLPEAPLAYRLAAPGMEPLAGNLDDDPGSLRVGFELAPAVGYLPRAARLRGPSAVGKRPAPAGAAEEAPAPRWDLVQRARAAMTAGDVPYAIGLLERAVEEASGEDLLDGLLMLADCYAAAGRYSQAARTFDRVAGLAPGTETAQNSRYEVGRLAADRLGDPARARAAFTSYLASPVGGALREDAWFSLCKLDGREAKHREALHCFHEFLRVYPGGHHQAEARLWRGALTQDVEKHWAAAERDLVWFLEARPRHPRVEEARYRVALGRYQAGDRGGALRMISEYLREHPEGQYKVRIERLRRAAMDPSAPRPARLD